MRHIAHTIHSDFKLNGQSFSDPKELLELAKHVSDELVGFLEDWFAVSPSISVKTSGSTGIPKTIHLKKKFMIQSAIETGNYFKLPSTTTALMCLPMEFIAGKMMIVRALCLGWHIDVISPSTTPLNTIDKEYDFCAMVPLQLEHSLDKIQQIKKLIVGGGAVSVKLQKKLQQLQTEIFATYGMTETITHIAVKKLNHETHSPSFYECFPKVTIYKDVRDCLVIEAPNISEEVLFTNDVVQLVSENQFDWLGRYDNVVNSGGLKLHPEKIEEKLSAFVENPFFITGLSDESLGEKLVLFVEMPVASEIEKNLFSEEVVSKMKECKSLLKYEIPKEIYLLKSFCRTPTGKIQRKETKQLLNKD